MRRNVELIMSEPHIIVEREFHWDDFCPLLLEEDRAVKIKGRIYRNDRFRLYSRNDEEKLVFFDSGGCFFKKFNEIINYGLGTFHLIQQRFDTVKTDEMEEVWLMDGMVEERPVIKELNTYQLITVPLQIYRPEKF